MTIEDSTQIISKLDALHARLDSHRVVKLSPRDIIDLYHAELLSYVEARDLLGYTSSVEKVRTINEAVNGRRKKGN